MTTVVLILLILTIAVAVFVPIRSRLRIAAGWGKGCAARASTVETGYLYTSCSKDSGLRLRYFCSKSIANSLKPAKNVLPERILANSSLYSKIAASRSYRAPILSKEQMCGEHRFLAENYFLVFHL